MQPYFFPYPGYFALMHGVDIFVFLDDAQYIDRGWVNRNRILQGGKPSWWTLPVRAAARDLPIKERRYLVRESRDRLLRRLEAAYRGAPHRAEVMQLVDDVLGSQDAAVADLNILGLTHVGKQVGVRARFIRSSEIGNAARLRGQARIISLCCELGADQYINPAGGVALYDPEAFRAAGLRLTFQAFQPLEYDQWGRMQVPNLSILDSLMFNGFEATAVLTAARPPLGNLPGRPRDE